MATTDEILDKARELGDLIAEHPSAKKLESVLQRLQGDTEAQRAMTDYERHLRTLSEKQESGRPIEVDDKRKLEKLQMAVIKNPILRDMQVAQMDYLDLMRRVDEAIQGQAPAPGSGEGAAGGPPLGQPNLGDFST